MGDAERKQAEQNIAFGYDMIRSAATMLGAFPYAETAKSLRSQEDMAWFTDPTMMKNADPDDWRRKLELLDAAASFVATFKRIGDEVKDRTDG